MLAQPEPPASPAPLDEIPSASPESVARLLLKIRRRYGDDAVVMQTHLLLNAMRNGSLLASGVRVHEVTEHAGKRYLGFHVETGMIFDDHTRDLPARIHVLWLSILEPTLMRLKQLEVPADGVHFAMQYHHRPYRTVEELRREIEQPGVAEEASFYLLAADVREMIAHRVTPRALLERARITVDGADRTIPQPGASPPVHPGPL